MTPHPIAAVLQIMRASGLQLTAINLLANMHGRPDNQRNNKMLAIDLNTYEQQIVRDMHALEDADFALRVTIRRVRLNRLDITPKGAQLLSDITAKLKEIKID